MVKLFDVDKGMNVTINKTELLLIPEFKKLVKRSKKCDGDHDGRKKLWALREFTFIYYYCDWKSPLRDYTEEAKKMEAFKVSGLSDKDIDGFVREAMDIYVKYQETTSTKLLESGKRAVENLTTFFDEVDLQEVDENGKPLYKPMDIMNALKSIGAVYKGLKELEELVKKEQQEQGSIRGQAKRGSREDPT